MVGLLLLAALQLAVALPGMAAAQGAISGPVLRGTGVRGSSGAAPTNVPVADAPTAVNVVGLTVSEGTARIELPGPYEALGPAHVVALTLSAPGAPLRRLVLAGDGRTSDEVLTDGRFVPQGSATVSVEGNVVAFALPVESAADWGVQAEAWLPDQGLHSHTAIAPLGAMTGELPPLATAGVSANEHGPAWYLPARALPDAVRPVAVAVEERAGGPVVVVEMAAPPQAVTELDGEPVTAQAVTVVLGGALHQGAERVVADPAAATGTVSVDGRELIFPFEYRDAPPPAAPAGLPADAPARAGTAVATPVTCGSPESYVVDVAMAGGELVLTHFDGDVARGAVDPATGAGTLSSPDGRIYQVQSVTGVTITVPELSLRRLQRPRDDHARDPVRARRPAPARRHHRHHAGARRVPAGHRQRRRDGRRARGAAAVPPGRHRGARAGLRSPPRRRPRPPSSRRPNGRRRRWRRGRPWRSSCRTGPGRQRSSRW